MISGTTTEDRVKQKPAHPRTRTLTVDNKAGGSQPGSQGLLTDSLARSNSDPRLKTDYPDRDRSSSEESELRRIKELPREVGVMLITAGIVGFVLPGPGTPAIIAGGLALWPTAFGKLESWLERRHPGVHRQSMKQIGRFLDDLERRYPYADHD